MSECMEGYFWTKVDGEWEPAFHQGDGDWRIYGGWAEDDWFEEIGPRIPTPDEPWQCVPDTADEEMLSEGVESLTRGQKLFGDNLTQIVSNIHEDMLAAAPKPEDV